MTQSRDRKQTHTRTHARSSVHIRTNTHRIALLASKTITGPNPSNLFVQSPLFSEIIRKQLYCLSEKPDELFSSSDLSWYFAPMKRGGKKKLLPIFHLEKGQQERHAGTVSQLNSSFNSIVQTKLASRMLTPHIANIFSPEMIFLNSWLMTKHFLCNWRGNVKKIPLTEMK